METVERGRLFVITGPSEEAKVGVGSALARTLSKSVFIDGATVDDMIVNGREALTDDPPEAAIEQLLFRYVGILALADAYRAIGFDAVVSEFIVGDYLADFLEIAAPETVHFIVLHPGIEGDPDPDSADSESARLGLWIDNSDHTIGETVLEILRRQDEAALDTSALAAPNVTG